MISERGTYIDPKVRTDIIKTAREINQSNAQNYIKGARPKAIKPVKVLKNISGQKELDAYRDYLQDIKNKISTNPTYRFDSMKENLATSMEKFIGKDNADKIRNLSQEDYKELKDYDKDFFNFKLWYQKEDDGRSQSKENQVFVQDFMKKIDEVDNIR